MGHPAFAHDYELFWRTYRAPEQESRDLDTILSLAGLKAEGRILDLACGFGRVANPLASRGYDVVGVDSSPELLDVARREGVARADFVLGDMRTFEAPKPFDVVLIWSTSLGYYSESDDEQTIATAWSALRPGGVLLIESRHWDTLDRQFEPYTERHHGADALREWHRYDPLLGRQVTRQEVTIGGRTHEREYHLRRYGVPELRAMTTRLGFVDAMAFDELGAALQPYSRRAILRAIRASEGI